MIDLINKSIEKNTPEKNKKIFGEVKTVERGEEKLFLDEKSNHVYFDDTFDLYCYHRYLKDEVQQLQGRGRANSYSVLKEYELVIFVRDFNFKRKVRLLLQKIPRVRVISINENRFDIVEEETNQNEFNYDIFDVFKITYQFNEIDDECHIDKCSKEPILIPSERTDVCSTISNCSVIQDILEDKHTHENKTILDLITEAFTTELKTVYDTCKDWIETYSHALLSHLTDTTNPHSVTKAQVGLSNVENVDTTTTANISDSVDKRFVTDADLVILSNTSGTNTGDETKASIETKLAAASATNNGYLSASDWSMFNAKQNDLGYTPENEANKKTTMSGNESSNVFYLSAKAIYEWANSLFLKIGDAADRKRRYGTNVNSTVTGTTSQIVIGNFLIHGNIMDENGQLQYIIQVFKSSGIGSTRLRVYVSTVGTNIIGTTGTPSSSTLIRDSGNVDTANLYYQIRGHLTNQNSKTLNIANSVNQQVNEDTAASSAAVTPNIDTSNNFWLVITMQNASATNVAGFDFVNIFINNP